MGKFYSISLHGAFANVLHMEKKKATYKILDEEVLDIHELPRYLANKRSFYIVVDTEEALDDVITVPSVIKNKTVLRGYILKRFKDSLPSKNIFLNYNKLSEDKEESTITYKIDAIDQKSYLKKLDLIPDWQEIKSATVEKFAFLNLTRKCFDTVKGYGYFSIFTHASTVTVLAIDEKGDLLFERTSSTLAGDDNSKYLNIVEEVTQTIAYVQQQFRSVEFSTMVIAGSLSFDDQAAEHLHFSTNLAVAVMYPNTFIDGLVDEEPQHYIITLGAFLVDKKDRFLPDKVYSLQEFNIGMQLLLLLSVVVLGLSSFNVVERFESYSSELERYETIKARLVHMVRSTDTYDEDELEKSYKHLQIAEKFLRYHPTDFLLQLKPLIEMLKPKGYNFNEDESGEALFRINFQRKFQTLGELYRFKQTFLQKFNKINSDNRLEYIEKSNYKKLEFIVSISNKVVPKQPAPPRRQI